MILRPLDRLHENDGFDDQSRFLLSLNDFAERESSTLLDTIFYYWDALRGGSDKVPNVRHFELRNVFGQNTPDPLSAVVTDTANPRNFVLVNHGTSQLGPFGADLEGKRLRDVPSVIHARATAQEYQQCKLLRRPLYDEIDQVIGGISRHYVRIMLPLANDQGDVVKIAYGIRALEPNYYMMAPEEIS